MKSHAKEDDLDVRQSKQIKQIYILIVTDKKKLNVFDLLINGNIKLITARI